jgi:hypothetical protein
MAIGFVNFIFKHIVRESPRLIFTLIWQQRQDQPAPDLLILKNGIYIQADPCQILNEYDNYNDHPHL